jgi:putative transposase
MDSQVLEPKKQELEYFIQGNPDAREVKRVLAVKWSLSGIPYRQIRKLLNVSLGFISKWNKNFSTRGVNGLKIAYKGKPSYLSQSDKEEIKFFLTWYSKSIAKSVKEIEKICQNINQVLVRLDLQG